MSVVACPDYSYIMRYVLYTGTAVVHAIPAEILFSCLKVCDRISIAFLCDLGNTSCVACKVSCSLNYFIIQ